MPCAHPTVPADLVWKWRVLKEICGLLEREKIASAVDRQLKARQVSPQLRWQIRDSIESADVEQLAGCIQRDSDWEMLREICNSLAGGTYRSATLFAQATDAVMESWTRGASNR